MVHPSSLTNNIRRTTRASRFKTLYLCLICDREYSKRTSEEYQVGRVSIFRRNHHNSTTLALLCGRDLRSAARSTLENTFSDNSGSNEEGALTLCDLTLHVMLCFIMKVGIVVRNNFERSQLRTRLQTWNLKIKEESEYTREKINNRI